MPEFDKNADYIWAIVMIGLVVPIALSIYAVIRARISKARLQRLQSQEDET